MNALIAKNFTLLHLICTRISQYIVFAHWMLCCAVLHRSGLDVYNGISYFYVYSKRKTILPLLNIYIWCSFICTNFGKSKDSGLCNYPFAKRWRQNQSLKTEMVSTPICYWYLTLPIRHIPHWLVAFTQQFLQPLPNISYTPTNQFCIKMSLPFFAAVGIFYQYLLSCCNSS